jgi:hypothetical protein
MADDVMLLGPALEEALDAGLRKAGVLCSLCGRTAEPATEPIGEGRSVIHTEGPGTMMEYVIVTPSIAKGQGKPTVNVSRIFHCQREDCDATSVAEKANARRQLPAFEVMD